jgi:ribose transport system permease protein
MTNGGISRRELLRLAAAGGGALGLAALLGACDSGGSGESGGSAGGKATVTGTFFGVITFALIFNLLNLLNMPAEIQGIVKGVLILAAVALQRRD